MLSLINQRLSRSTAGINKFFRCFTKLHLFKYDQVLFHAEGLLHLFTLYYIHFKFLTH